MIDVIIIGGGVSGIISSIYAKNESNRVVVLEKNSKVLKKLLLTGNGRCNYLNEVYGTKFYHSKNIDIVDKIISDKNINEIKKFFDNLGIIPKIKNGYYYPFSNQASTIRDSLVREALRRGVEIVCDCDVLDIYKEEEGFRVVCSDKEYKSNKIVLSTGSYAYPKTGSDGFGYGILSKLGHNIIKPLPALVQLTSDIKFLKEWDGVRTDVELELFEDKKFVDRETGEIQLTKYGISGICTFNLSHYVTRGIDEGHEEEIHINFVPFIKTLITPWMDNYSKNNSHKNIHELLEGFLNYKLVSVILKTSNIRGDLFYLDLSNEEKLRLCHNLRSFRVPITGDLGFSSAQICNGGMSLLEINYRTMESKIVSGLYIVGELLDVNGNCGGYNLTNCFISGMLAGKDIGGFND